jgi:hypothetical protein
MTFNISRKKTAICWQRAFKRYHQNLVAPRSMALVDGGCFHLGIAEELAKQSSLQVGLSAISQKTTNSEETMLQSFEQEVSKSSILPEQSYIIDDNRELLKELLRVAKEGWATEQYQVIQPECKFEVELPNSSHYCIFKHWMDTQGVEHWEPPPYELIQSGSVRSPHSRENSQKSTDWWKPCKCSTSHTLKGTTDVIVAWKNTIWLVDWKTTAISGAQFWDQWHLDEQMTAYLYGIWKKLSVRPSGFVINALIKPSAAQVSNWNKKRKSGDALGIKDYIRYEREAFLRSEEDLLRFEKEAVEFCNEWEWRITGGGFRMSPGTNTCMMYNRKCDYYQACLTHGEDLSLLVPREMDYVDLSQLGI